MASQAALPSSSIYPHNFFAESFQNGSGAQVVLFVVYTRPQASAPANAGLVTRGVSDGVFTTPTSGELTIKYNGPTRRVLVHNYGNIRRTTGATNLAAYIFHQLGRRNGSGPVNGDQLTGKIVVSHQWTNAYYLYSYKTIIDLVDDDYIAPMMTVLTSYSFELGAFARMSVQSYRKV